VLILDKLSVISHCRMVEQNTLSWQLIGAMHHLVHVLDLQAEKILSQSTGLSFAQFQLLMMLESAPGSCQREIADCFGLTQAGVSKQVSSLEKLGVISRSIITDNRRQKVLTITPKGKASMRTAINLLEPYVEELFSSVSSAQQKQFLSSCHTIIEDISKEF
jgi:DNA-binding MarR family transcriptional regulator